jgi:hypothetical protein
MRFKQLRAGLSWRPWRYSLRLFCFFGSILLFLREYLTYIVEVILFRWWLHDGRLLASFPAWTLLSFAAFSFRVRELLIREYPLLNFLSVEFLDWRHLPQMIVESRVIVMLQFYTFGSMCFELLRPVEGLRTLLALIRPNQLLVKCLPKLLMSPFMINLVTLSGKLPPAVLTLKGLLASVCSQVMPQAGPLREVAIAVLHCTFVHLRLFPLRCRICGV